MAEAAGFDPFDYQEDDDLIEIPAEHQVEWLYAHIKESGVEEALGLSQQEMLTLLKSNLEDVAKTDQDVEEDFISILGFANIAVIRAIIAKRFEIVDALSAYTDVSQKRTSEENYSNDRPANVSLNPKTVDPVQKKHNVREYNALVSSKKRMHNVPGQSIVVNTQEEKRTWKEVKKIERKIQRENNKGAKGRSSNQTQSQLNKMRTETREALIDAMAGPLFKEPSMQSIKGPSYPYVFDSLIEARASAAYIAGSKLILPAGFTRKEHKEYEELLIPAPPKPPSSVLEQFKTIQINDLDSIGQKGFDGFKQLNPIQSIVFETAYNTNENILVCAPTGAGKTNIAMLTILHQIKKYMQPDGHVKLDQFKIVYIAPMKALVAEMVDNFTRRLKPFNMKVRELTGDMQLTKAEIAATNMIVTVPEKWDIITRKPSGVHLMELIKLTIIDEVHLLESDRGPVLEALVARIIRHVESTQTMSRLVGLSATLPNYVDVAEFLGVSLNRGLFVFDNRFRPVPLELSFIGIKASQLAQQNTDIDEVCYEKVKSLVSKGHQVMIFVHSRNMTYKVASNIKKEAQMRHELQLFNTEIPEEATKAANKSKNKLLKELIPDGFAIHHAGLLRGDRNTVEALFRDGGIKVLCCTSTLAWGVNLPAHAVIIRGTDVYDSGHGKFVDLSMLDVMQIFGRAGRPQYDTSGYACIITLHEKLSHYLSMLTNQCPIESNFLKYITDNLNAEIVAGTVTDLAEGMDWLRYTYLLIRMKKNPLFYGMGHEEPVKDRSLQEKRNFLIASSIQDLMEAKMIEITNESTYIPTDLGRVASFYYIKYDTVLLFNNYIHDDMEEERLLQMISNAGEFEQLKAREDEIDELIRLKRSCCRLRVPEGVETIGGKVNILIQAHLSRARIECFSLSSDCFYIVQNVVRMVRGVFEYARKSGWGWLAHRALLLAKMVDQQLWNSQSPFRQFSKRELNDETLMRLDRNSRLTPALLASDELNVEEIGSIVRHPGKGKIIKTLAHQFPRLEVKAEAKKVNSSVVHVTLNLKPIFKWNDSYHGKSQPFWIWCSEPESGYVFHSDFVLFTKQETQEQTNRVLEFTIHLEYETNQLSIHVDSDIWLGCDTDLPLEVN